jgi:capsular exopolysaccharide synthesis family protein
MHNEDSDSYLKEHLWRLWVRRGSILIVAALVAGVTLLYFSRQTRLYRASVEVLVQDVTLQPPQQGGDQLKNLEPERHVATSREVTKLAAERLGPTILTTDLTVRAPESTDTLVFTVSSPIPVSAQRTAQAYADAYLEFRRHEIIQDLQSASQPLEQRIAELNTNLDTVQRTLSAADTESQRTALQIRFNSLFSQRAVLEQKRNELIFPENLRVGRVLQPAVRPSAPYAPSPGRSIALALFAGLTLGIGQASLRARFDPRLQGRTDLASGADAPVLGLIPEPARSKPEHAHQLMTVTAPRSPDAEAYRALRATFLFAVHEHGIRSVVITGPSPGDGKTSTVANLGAALANLGKRVILVSADLHRPKLQLYFRETNEVGLTTVLAGTHRVLDAVNSTSVPGLRVLHTGPVGNVTPEVLGSGAMRLVLDELELDADFVLIDTPPVLTAADTLAIAPLADAVLLVAAAERTSSVALAEARLQLEQIGAFVIGAVLNNVDRSRARFDQRYVRQNGTLGSREQPSLSAGNARSL